MPASPPHLPAPPAIDAEAASLFLDFDGTLVEIAERPDAVAVPADLPGLLDRAAARLDGRLAVVSGRSLAQLDGFLGALGERLAMVGSHGAELRLPGAAIAAPDVPPAFLLAEQAFAEAFGGNPDVLIEAKTLGVAIHYRLDPAAEVEAKRLAAAFAAEHGLELQHGKMMVEVRTAGHDKGSGIAALMRRPPFAGTAPWFAGDDVTDEHGFAACAMLGGAGVLVGAERPTAAAWRLPDAAAVRAWIAAL